MEKRYNLSVYLFFLIVFVLIGIGCKREGGGINNNKNNASTFTDPRDGKVYKTITIGKQVWMAENLNYETSGGSWVYHNNSRYATAYGRLYDWETAQKVCPEGWHLPSDAEWAELTDYLGGESVAGGKLKEAGTSYWSRPNKKATNKTGFSALPGGYRDNSGNFGAEGLAAYFWSSTANDSNNAWRRKLYYDQKDINRYNLNKNYGFSVRCVRD